MRIFRKKKRWRPRPKTLRRLPEPRGPPARDGRPGHVRMEKQDERKNAESIVDEEKAEEEQLEEPSESEESREAEEEKEEEDVIARIEAEDLSGLEEELQEEESAEVEPAESEERSEA